MERKDFVKIIQIKAIFFYVLIDFHGEETTIFSAQFYLHNLCNLLESFVIDELVLQIFFMFFD